MENETKKSSPELIAQELTESLMTEKNKLDEKRNKLEAFQNNEAFKNIEPIQMSLLNIQAQAMATYSQCLLERISWNKKIYKL